MIESLLAVVDANLPLLRPLLYQETYTSSNAWSLLHSWRNKRSVINISDGEPDNPEALNAASLRLGVYDSRKELVTQSHVPQE